MTQQKFNPNVDAKWCLALLKSLQTSVHTEMAQGVLASRSGQYIGRKHAQALLLKLTFMLSLSDICTRIKWTTGHLNSAVILCISLPPALWV